MTIDGDKIKRIRQFNVPDSGNLRAMQHGGAPTLGRGTIARLLQQEE